MRYLILAALASVAMPTGAATYELKATPQTVAWGHYDATDKPVLTIRSGDTVVIHTLLTNSPAGLEKAGVAPAQIEPALRAVYDGVPVNARGPGGHILTGPIAITGAEPGDMLEVRIRKVDLAIPYAYNAFRYGAGFLTDDFPYARMKIVPLDAKRMVGLFAPGVEVPLAPFFGSMGVAPPPSFGRYDSAPPTINGGNMDDKALVAGTTLFLPVYAPGALFQVGDGHAAQGNGEVDITALETSLTGTFEFVLHKKAAITYPRAETPKAYIAMGFDDDLSHATRKALRNMIDFLVAEKGMTRDDAYMLISVAGDVEITELVDRNKGVHVVLPKAVFTKR
ncbi:MULTISPECIES: acetamidase/formamidase family protein [unclassified Sphingomonas]|uniref:acetamidase/formamidase family protein n=1 Tax=unclassified Sphingomonas TaxID=196159 RepID=UPI000E720078|nr:MULTISPECIES: acetamidase/formamidase family protein [unclassified Sphingomonas]RKE50631.1 acetamidase/formamidase [Sphingomonas sp. PP-CC-1A-547]TCM08928.1 acetamidase/formamidase [Sphingomonas sp. PP-CC-3G-468]